MPDSSIGLIMVHGIGGQGRFEHLDAHLRGVIQGLRRTGATVTVEIVGAPSAALQAAQDTWASGPAPAVRLIVRQGQAVTRISVHEVWWADVNERYAPMKQVRFWLWGLSAWRFRPYASAASLPTHASMFPPRYATLREWHAAIASARVRLFGLGCFFLVASLTAGVASVLLKRLLKLNPPAPVRVFVNYLSSVKLYTQPHREGADFLDNIGIPPRFSIRRRMIRTIADVACHGYDRWHILAHSQGAVVAFNGLMEPAFGWPGYLDEARWDALRGNGMAGPATPGAPAPETQTTPPRPVWLAPDQIVYRRRVFGRFAGILTYGCPLEKFAAIWPATVAVCREPAFGEQATWLNVFDPVDPVSGEMVRWPTEAQACIPRPQNIGYASSPWLLLGHTEYLACPMALPGQPAASGRDWRLADGVAQWLRTNAADGIMQPAGERFFAPRTPRADRRRRSMWVQWAIAFALADGLGALAAPFLTPAVGRAALAMLRGTTLARFYAWLVGLLPILGVPAEVLRWVARQPILHWAVILPVVSLVATGLVGWVQHLRSEPRRVGKIPLGEPFSPVPPPDPPPDAPLQA